jgi:hypothetical protein
MSARSLSSSLALAMLLSLGAACDDPVEDAAVAALGPENPNVPPGPLHRPGQPCLVCHDPTGGGPASLEFATAGTVFQDATDPTPLVAATVVITDLNMKVMTAETNCAGNFFIEAVDWDLTFPVHLQVNYGGMQAEMVSHMAKTDSCAQCHVGVTATPETTTQVYLNQQPMTYPPSGCP